MDFGNSQLPDRAQRLLASLGRNLEYDCDGGSVISLVRTEVSDHDLADLICYPGFDKLDLAYTRISDVGLQHIGKMTYLESLRLEGTGIADRGVVELAGLSRLETLHIGDSDILFPGRPALPADIRRKMKITDAALGHLTSLTSLHDLNLTRTRVTDDGLLRYLPELTQLQGLSLNCLDITDAGVEALHHFN